MKVSSETLIFFVNASLILSSSSFFINYSAPPFFGTINFALRISSYSPYPVCTIKYAWSRPKPIIINAAIAANAYT